MIWTLLRAEREGPNLPEVDFLLRAAQHRAERTAGWDTGWRTLPFTLCETPAGGAWILETDEGTRRVAEGDAFVIGPGTPHRLRAPRPIRTSWFYAQWEIGGLSLNVNSGTTRAGRELALAVDEITSGAESVKMDLAKLARIKRHGMAWLEFLHDKLGVDTVADERVARAVRYARENFRRRVTRADLAKAAGVSEPRLHELFVAEMGVAPIEHVLGLRLQHATMLLTNTREPVGRVAEASGFSSVYYFSRHFRKRTGCAPSAFRHTRGLAAGAGKG